MTLYSKELPFPQIPDRLTGNPIEIGGIPVKCISSNIRRIDIAWNEMHVMSGIGKEGNIIIVEAASDVGFRTEIENQYGREEKIYKGDRFVAVLANRNSGTSESGDVPTEGITINEETELHLLAAGAIVGIKSGIPVRKIEPMPLKPLGLVSKDGQPLDLIELSGGHHEQLEPSAPIIMVCGTSAEVGKTTASIGLIRALKSEGMRVAGTKFTGTGRMRDILSLRDAGAVPWLDFPEIGLPTTYTSQERFIKGIYTLFNDINAGNPDIIIAEAGGDLIEANVPTFLQHVELMKNVKAIVLVAGDVMGMMGAIDYLHQYTGNIPIFLTDPKDRNPVTTRERVRHQLPGVVIFNSLNEYEVKDIVRAIMLK